MSLSQVRTYFKARLMETDSDFREHKDAFNYDNIPQAIRNKSYHIELGPLSSLDQVQSHTADSMDVTVRLFYKSNKDNQDEYDNGMDVANILRLKCINIVNVQPQENMKKVILNSITPEFSGNNDNAIVITLSFSVDMIFNVC